MADRTAPHRLRRGSAAPLLLVLLVALIGAGGWNYHRNMQAEAQQPRPYRSYDDTQLAALIEAYEQEVESLEARHAASRERRAAPGSGTMLGERVADFERAAQRGRETRGLAKQAAGQGGVLDELRHERDLRSTAATGFALHLKRLLTI